MKKQLSIMVGLIIIIITLLVIALLPTGDRFDYTMINQLKTASNNTINNLINDGLLNESPYTQLRPVIETLNSRLINQETFDYYTESISQIITNELLKQLLLGNLNSITKETIQSIDYNQLKNTINSIGAPNAISVVNAYSTNNFDYLQLLVGNKNAFVKEYYYNNGEYIALFSLPNTVINKTLMINQSIMIYEEICYKLAIINKTYLYGLIVFDRGNCTNEFMNNFEPLLNELANTVQANQ
ncbi:MAG: hypothetical protein WC307_03890 [Candidatus Nanoarchaeia archaeon]|jgi:hypothetical protein